jgi:hypothetical protein
MQLNPISERELVKQCMAELCKQAGFSSCENMVQRDLEFLCDSIESKTGVLISLSTMRRLFNGQFSRQPQVATLNAIVLFLGYQNWQDFKRKKNPEPQPQITPEKITRTRRPKFSYILGGAVLILAALALLAMLKLRKHPLNNIESAQFSVNKTTRNDLPNTVVFHYNIDDVTADSFFIQQSWDINRRVRINKNNYTLTDIYYEPGYHVAKLIANDQVIRTMGVSIPTDRWFFYTKEKKPLSNPVYISAKGTQNGALQMTRDELVKSQVDIQTGHQYIQVYFPTSILHSSDHYRLKYRVRVNMLNNDPCPYLMSEVFCQNNFMFFTTTPKGCTSELKAQFSENYLSGKTNDLSAMGIDVKEWHNMELTVQNKKVTVRINDAEVFSTSYNQSGGLITGLGFISNGLVEVDFVDFRTIDGVSIYGSDFE